MLTTKDIEAADLQEGDTAIIDGKPTLVEDIRSNSMGCWVYSNNHTSSRHYRYGELVAKVVADSYFT